MALGKIAIDTSPLKASPDFRKLFAATLLSMLGTWLTSVGASIQVYDLGGSSLHVGMVNLVIGLSMFIGLLAGGVLADRVDRRLLILRTRAGSAVVVLLLVVNALVPSPQLWVLYVLAIAAGVIGGLGSPALMAVTPALVGREHIAAAGAFLTITIQFGAMLGPGLAGLIAAGPGVATCYALDAAGFIVGAVLLSRLPPLPPDPDASADPDDKDATQHPLHAIAEGFRYVKATPVIRGLILVDAAAVVLAMPFALFPEMGEEVFEGGAITVGLLYAAPAVGANIGALVSGWTARVSRPGVVLVCASSSWGLAVLGFGLSKHLWLGLLMLVVAGFADTISEILRRAMVHHYTPDRLQGRVGSLWLAQSTSGPAVGNALSGSFGRLIGAGTTLVAGGIACVAAVATTGAAEKPLRHASLTNEAHGDGQLGAGQPPDAAPGTDPSATDPAAAEPPDTDSLGASPELNSPMAHDVAATRPPAT